MNTTNEVTFDSMTRGFGLSTSIAVFFNVLLMIAKEHFVSLKDFMKSISFFGIHHHWLAHGFFLLLIFIILGSIFTRMDIKVRDSFLRNMLIASFVISSSSIVIFFLLEFFA